MVLLWYLICVANQVKILFTQLNDVLPLLVEYCYSQYIYIYIIQA